MYPVQAGPAIGLSALLGLLAALAATVGLGAAGWLAGAGCALAGSVVLARAMARRGMRRFGPADRVTLTRAVLAGGVAALVADSFSRPGAGTGVLVTLSAGALALDCLDGWLARRTGTASDFGARFDLEVDAFLIAVLSCFVARTLGPVVLLIGLARYVLVAAGWRLEWLRRPTRPRYWRKAVAAVQGVTLTVAASGVLPRAVSLVAVLAALGMLAGSFGSEVYAKWRDREQAGPAVSAGRPGAPVGFARRTANRRALAALLTGLAGLGVWLALIAPDRPDRLTPLAFVRVPVEAVVLAGLAVLVRGRARHLVAALAGVGLALVAVVKALDLGFGTALDRPFHPVADWGYFDSAAGLLADSVGHREAGLILLGLGALALAVLVGLPLAVLRLARLADRHRVATVRAGVVLGLVWLNCAVLGVQFVAGTPVASTDAARLAWDRAGQAGTDLRDERAFARAALQDPLRDTPAQQLLTGLRGKDVLIAFVESYGRVAVQGTSFSPGVDAVLDAGTTRLQAAGFCSRSAFLTSPTFGGISWLAHSTLQSGLWVDNQLRYDRLMASSRSTLSVAFGRAGWRTVSVIPANEKAWPEGETFYHYDQRYDSTNTGYAGPKFSYATMPDQYTLAALQRRELAPTDRRPVMAEIDLVSSHTPWAPLPRLVDWAAVGDGSVFDPMPAEGPSASQVWPDPARVRAAYGRSVQYSLNALVSFVQHYGNDNLVLILLGDHQPATIVSGTNAGHDVPISIVARDPAVLDRVSAWGWQDGLRPGPDAPVWPMSDFRDRFLSAYGPQPQAQPLATVAGAACGR